METTRSTLSLRRGWCTWTELSTEQEHHRWGGRNRWRRPCLGPQRRADTQYGRNDSRVKKDGGSVSTHKDVHDTAEESRWQWGQYKTEGRVEVTHNWSGGWCWNHRNVTLWGTKRLFIKEIENPTAQAMLTVPVQRGLFYDHSVEQRVADSSIVVLGHGGEKTGCCPPEKVKETLSDAAPHWDAFLLRQEVS